MINYKAENIFSVEGKTAVITGASKGIGKEIAKLMNGNGANTALIARSKTQLQKLKDELSNTGSRVEIYPFDLTNFDELESLANKINDDFGQIDILINNAGINIPKPIEEVSVDDWDIQNNINLKSTYFFTKYIGEKMKKLNKGKIINISSQMAFVGYFDRSVYSTTKGGITQLTKAFSIEWSKFNINVNAIAPTFIETELTQTWFKNQEFKKEIIDKIPLGKLAKKNDLFGSVLLLSSDASDMMTGNTVFVDGGWTVW
ncbi:SDR family NAD(P)-dependent oxidoreductase [Mammaliicoccus lentus]|jgi:NAD(P)-dependent dehydrogenase (short-subunit alcohol dehydrogenase family)|uniref:SDR family NAD(P)-dependent oxidoreductase n=1 Tax=Mammaliicoccus lentus TaxID=42858 RepID=UPI002A5A0BC1|nr:SDR family NAD(P)-dependent oxidoreductase [Mammaliicoccus lentus]WQL56086.1 SDR family oxidoreductase [Mammaliicoccus lentus]